MTCFSRRLRRSFPVQRLLPVGAVVAKDSSNFEVPSVLPTLNSVLQSFTRETGRDARADSARTDDAEFETVAWDYESTREAAPEEELPHHESDSGIRNRISTDSSEDPPSLERERPRRTRRLPRRVEIRRESW